MKVKLVSKNCRQCGTLMESVSSKVQICDNCREVNYKLHANNGNKRKKENNYPILLKKYTDNFIECTRNNGNTLTIAGFNNISELKYDAYRNFFKLPWIDIIKYFNKYKELLKYIKEEFSFHLNNGYNISYFYGNKHKYITYNLIRAIGTEQFLELCDIGYTRYSNIDYENNFISIKTQLGHIPLYTEFIKLTKISFNSYCNHLSLKDKLYKNIVKAYSIVEEYNDYTQRQQENKSNVGRQTANIGKILLTLEDLEIEFRRVFDKCFQETGVYPSRRLFNKLSKHDDKTYRQKFNMRWTDICKYFGYPSHQDKYIFENYVLKHISQILNDDFESQKTFSWLKGINNFPLFCDGYFQEHNLIVEVDGRQHRKPYSKFGGEEAFKILQENDRIKNKLILEHGIRLLRIADNTNWHNVKYLKSRLDEVLEINSTSSPSAK